jgi:hypothetical protein
MGGEFIYYEKTKQVIDGGLKFSHRVLHSSGSEAPQESILYSLVTGRTELIMFGGLKKDISLGGVR